MNPKAPLTTAALLSLAVFLAGCAGMAQGVKTSAYRQQPPAAVERGQPGPRSSSSVIRP
jgi:hypothetical protein